MSFNLSAIAVRERAVTLFFIILLAAAGAYAFVKLGRAEDPSFTIKSLTVTPSHGRARPRARCRTSSPSRWRNVFRN
jgi:multidrug efflux pump subunit AcrB